MAEIINIEDYFKTCSNCAWWGMTDGGWWGCTCPGGWEFDSKMECRMFRRKKK